MRVKMRHWQEEQEKTTRTRLIPKCTSGGMLVDCLWPMKRKKQLRKQQMKLHLMLAVNNEYGNRVGQVDRVEIDDLISLEGEPVSCVYLPQAVMVGSLWFNHEGYQTWVGNICWDCATLESKDVAAIINYLHKLGWSCTEAETGLFEAYHNDESITAKMLEDLMEAAE
jgi:hypothetical protein